ncbi:MAG: DUF3253 domain-containing protein [Nannocystaceae bacterium]|nr:DUF2256 and DUF3253 domain-containing protein [bacterium]
MKGESKVCASCGRAFSWRKKWARHWDAVRFCSAACRRAKVSAKDRALEAAIVALLDARGPGKTICPSEAARRVDPEQWRPLMEPARRAARRMVARGELEICQRGKVVDPTDAKGPIRLRRP